MILLLFACVVGYVVLFLKMGFKPLTTLKFSGDRFVITPPQRCFAEVITNRWSVCCVVNGLVKVKVGVGWNGEERRKRKERKKEGVKVG